MITPKEITVVYHSRKKFYNGRDIYWYEFFFLPTSFPVDDEIEELANLIPQKFLNIPCSVYYEFGGSHEEAIKCLTEIGIRSIVEGNEL
jgi:hypothetical protein